MLLVLKIPAVPGLSSLFPAYNCENGNWKMREISTDVEIKDGLPVITASEDSNTLDPLLRFCYPCSPADDSVLDENLKRCRKRTRGGKKKTYSLDTIERMAEKENSWIRAEYPRYSAVPWMAASHPSGHGRSQHSTSGRHLVYGNAVAPWWETFMDTTFLDLRDKPRPETIRQNVEKAIQTVRQRNCVHCSVSAPRGVRDFGALFIGKKLSGLVKPQVELELRF
ncbi:hypothetical protein EDD16DRAFT_1725549 [Pisolithus croceorrhizus]|nr:hypothetical protein EDD16DRAFT_1725549 [Pisolithus croceorrhizus]